MSVIYQDRVTFKPAAWKRPGYRDDLPALLTAQVAQMTVAENDPFRPQAF